MQQNMEKKTSSFVLQANLIIIEVQINGVEAQFILDTGAGASVLTKEFADRLGLKEMDRSAGAGAGGAVEMSIVRLETLSVAGITDRNVSCPVMDISAVRAQVGENIDGVLGFDFFGTGSLHIDYPNRRVTFERPIRVESNGAVIIDETIRLPRFSVELTIPSSGWQATTDTPLSMIPVIVTGPGDSKITVMEAQSHGLSVATMKVSIDASVAAQVGDYKKRGDARDVKRVDRPAHRLEYYGTADGVSKRFISEAVLFETGLLILTCEAPVDSFENDASAMESVLSSLRSMK